MSEQKTETTETKTTETTTETTQAVAPATEASSEPAPQAEPQVRVKEGLFKPFTLGSTLSQGPTGNVMANVKKPIMDYEKTYQQSIRNVQMTDKDFQKKDK
jgi:hypothetical protein